MVLSLLLFAGMLHAPAVGADSSDVEESPADSSEVEMSPWADSTDVSVSPGVDSTEVGPPGADSTDASVLSGVDSTDVSESPWAFSAMMTSYFGSTIDAYAVPDLWIEYHGFHLEGRYNYEDLHTGSMFLGWHFGWGDAAASLNATPMVGWVFGRTDGFAPALIINARLWRIQLYNEFEYVFAKDDESFAYDHADLIYALSGPVFMGIVGEHTLSSFDREFVPGFLVGASNSRFGVTFYLFQPGQEDAKGALELELEY